MPTVAASVLPSAEDATDCQYCFGRLFELHESPAFVEVKSVPFVPGITAPAATIKVLPSADEAIVLHRSRIGGEFVLHVSPPLMEVRTYPAPESRPAIASPSPDDASAYQL